MTTEPKAGQETGPAHQWLKDLREEDRVSGSYLVKEKGLQKTRGGKPFLSLILSDRTGQIPAKVWEQAESLSSLFKEGDVVRITGLVGSYRDQIQITVSTLDPVEGRFDPELFLEASPRDPSKMMRSLRGILRGIKDPDLTSLVNSFLADGEFLALFRKAPAAKNFHHNYLGGLLEHTLSVCELAVQVAAHYPGLNSDLLTAAAFLHDIGKIRELKYDLRMDYTDEGRLVGHVVLSLSMVEEKLGGLNRFPEDLSVRLKHMILSHHGQYDFGSPKEPKFLEAFALNMIDDLDAKMNGLRRFMEKDRNKGNWTEFNRMFGKYFLKGVPEPGPDLPPAKTARKDNLQRALFPSDPVS